MRSGVLLLFASVVSSLSMALAGWAIYARYDTAEAARQDNRQAWHAVVCYFEDLTVKGPASPEKKAEAIRTWEHILILVEAPSCKT